MKRYQNGELGSRWRMKYEKELSTLSDAIYFLSTTTGGFQTLGEEYCDILMVDSSGRFPSLSVRCTHSEES